MQTVGKVYQDRDEMWFSMYYLLGPEGGVETRSFSSAYNEQGFWIASETYKMCSLRSSVITLDF